MYRTPTSSANRKLTIHTKYIDCHLNSCSVDHQAIFYRALEKYFDKNITPVIHCGYIFYEQIKDISRNEFRDSIDKISSEINILKALLLEDEDIKRKLRGAKNFFSLWNIMFCLNFNIEKDSAHLTINKENIMFKSEF